MRQGIDRIEPGTELDLLAKTVIGAAIEVHKVIGPGYLESVYEEALCQELNIRGIAFVRQPVFTLTYKGVSVGQGRLDLLVEERLIVELKAVEVLAAIHHAQVISYLRALHLQLGLLINFNVPLLKQGIRRVINT
jgi:GxxExxY protein